ncbi:hypothetical protein SARC_00633 [Sphaeroforma arctica JP610]|uniref:Uncharacterized protein n=1 Tax=Sphaeroforma arctica JP610 TaxID=667725 RepID=A0A0L0GDZ3_9EUKA|nr:hypothetical protein SARC_00633 [Sphaeroforma arctica JP610]KNC87247.1 hypothetical protein SARC_00633 [Sphaeroforma arctica JP610]|eukprot:XP_014161149.1 hypothetical protein SARC_00633 [Sphaeroforma arctica JP610]
MKKLYSRLAIVAMCQVACLARTETEQDFSIGMRTLVLTSGANTFDELPIWVSQAYGVNFDTVSITEESEFRFPECTDSSANSENCGSMGTNSTRRDFSRIDLYDPETNDPKYNSIVLTTLNLGFASYDENFNSIWNQYGLTQETSDELDKYCVKYGVRTVSLNSSPIEIFDFAMAPAISEGGVAADNMTVLSFASNNWANDMRNILNQDARIRVGSETEVSANGAYWLTPALIREDQNVDGHMQPILNLDYTCPNGQACTGVGATLVRDRLSARETLHFHINMDLFGLHGVTLAHMWYPWVVRGLFLGERKVVLDCQVDDALLDTKIYDTTGTQNSSTEKYRMTEIDLKAHRDFQRNLNIALPSGSNFTLQMAFNGVGWEEFGQRKDYEPNLNEGVTKYFDEFLWVSHTWNHIDMYCLNSDCSQADPVDDPLFEACFDWSDGPCDYEGEEPAYYAPISGYTPYEYETYELTRNQYFAEEVLNVQEHEEAWSPRSMVTPRISGLNYTEGVRAMLAAGIFNAVGDNSRLDLKPANPWHPFLAIAKVNGDGEKLTTEDREDFEEEMLELYGARSVTIIPRFATRVYFDVSLPVEFEMEHNSIYGPNCTLCKNDTFKYDDNLTVDTLMEIEGFETARNLLSLRIEPYMFHQANLRMYSDGRFSTSLIQEWIVASLRWVKDYTTFPVYTYKMDDLAEYYRQRQERDECGLAGSIKYSNGRPVSVSISSDSSCQAKLTYTKTTDSAMMQPVTFEGSATDISNILIMEGKESKGDTVQLELFGNLMGVSEDR